MGSGNHQSGCFKLLTHSKGAEDLRAVLVAPVAASMLRLGLW